MTTKNSDALGWFMALNDLAPSGAERTTRANETEKKALAAQLDIPSVESCQVQWTIKPWRKTGVRVIGALHASVTQTCSVTLEPVPGEVTEDIDVRLTTEERLISGHTADKHAQNEALEFDPEDRDPPELFDGARIPLGDIAYEHLALGLEPYPRAAEVAFDGFESVGKGASPEVEIAETAETGFSALAQWGDKKPARSEN